MRANLAVYPVATMCRVLGVSPSGFYAWQGRGRSVRDVANEGPLERIREIYQTSRENYGAPNVHAELTDEGWTVNHKRVARLMRLHDIVGVTRRRGFTTTRRDADAQRVPDLVERSFTADAPDRLWVADITYIPTWAGFLYLAVVLDVCSRRIVGWSMENHLKTELVLQALNMAIWQRRPEAIIHHSDQGCQYTSIPFGLRCKEVGVRPSTGSVGELLRQRHVRKLLCLARARTVAEASIPDARRSEDGDLRLHRGAVQSEAPPLRPGACLTHHLRTEIIRCCLILKLYTVHEEAGTPLSTGPGARDESARPRDTARRIRSDLGVATVRS